MKYPTVSSNEYVQAFYVKMRKEGTSHNMAEMLALRKGPKSLTDRELFEGIGNLADQFRGDEAALDHITKTAIKNGYKPNYTDYYSSALADYPGDPKGFISAAEGRSKIKKVCEEKGVKPLNGIVDVTVDQYRDPPPRVKERLAKDLVEDNIQRTVAENPDMARVPRKDLEQEIIHRHGSEG